MIQLSPHRSTARALFALAGLGLGLAASQASAQAVECSSLPNPVYGIGGSAGTPFIKAVAIELAKAPVDPVTVIYTDTGACNAMTALVKNTPLSGTGKYWNAAGVEATCSYPSGSTQLADWGSMAQEATTCQGIEALPATVSDTIGPISGFSIIVPQASTQTSITAEAAYFVYGFGPGNGQDVKPWTNPASVASRTTTSAAGLLLAKAVGIPVSRALFGPDTKSNQGTIDYITAGSPSAVADPDTAIGFCSTETVESGANRSKVRTLAFQAVGQDCAYFPDSTDTATDKKNIREGRYYLWNPHHFFARLSSAGGAPVNANVAKAIAAFTGKTALPADKSYLDVIIATNTIPQCAMHVTRSGDMGPLASFQPDDPCGCFFDDKKTGNSGCTACTSNSECPRSAPVCRHNFCEVK